VIAASLLLLLLSAPRLSQAVEREQHVGLDLGGAMLVSHAPTSTGGALGAHWAYGLNDQFNLLAEATGSLLALKVGTDESHSRPGSLTNVDVGVAYVFDVLQWVPYAGLLVGGYGLAGGSIHGVHVLGGAAFALRLDYRPTRSWAFGISWRQHMMTEPSEYPSFTHLFLRAELTWGW
jgi:hypothetical protein